MSYEFNKAECQDNSNMKLFGLCDDNIRQRAYLNEDDGAKWIAVVVNEDRFNVTFTAIDNCIEIKNNDGKMEKRCDGLLSYQRTAIFVELKERSGIGNAWVIDGEKQLRTSIKHFEASEEADSYSIKKAYIANSEHPKFKESQFRRMNQFFDDTGYVLRIENRIILE